MEVVPGSDSEPAQAESEPEWSREGEDGDGEEGSGVPRPSAGRRGGRGGSTSSGGDAGGSNEGRSEAKGGGGGAEGEVRVVAGRRRLTKRG